MGQFISTSDHAGQQVCVLSPEKFAVVERKVDKSSTVPEEVYVALWKVVGSISDRLEREVVL